MSDLFASGSCGPSNPLQNLGKHSSNAPASQNERFIHSGSSISGFRSSDPHLSRQANNEFQAFQASSQPSTMDMFKQPNMSHQPQGYHFQQQQQQQQPNQMHQPGQDWTADFAKMSMSSSQPQSHRQNPASTQVNHYSPMYSSFSPAPLAMSSASTLYSGPAFAMQTEHKQVHAMENIENSFRDAFDQVESELNRQQEKELLQEKETIVSGPASDDLSEIASKIIGSVTSTSKLNESTTAKFKQSNFMALMEQLSKKDVILENDKFVTSSLKEEINVNELPRSSSAPVAQEPRNAPMTRSPDRDTSTGQSHLEDPFAFLERTGKSLDPSASSSFEVAEAIAPPGVITRSDWEESIE